MLSQKHQPIRNQIDLANANQIQIIRKRLKISESDLRLIVEKVGNSIAAVTKEVENDRLVAASPDVEAR
jgi:hypothetical protein